jgi:hypothetical protein
VSGRWVFHRCQLLTKTLAQQFVRCARRSVRTDCQTHSPLRARWDSAWNGAHIKARPARHTQPDCGRPTPLPVKEE